MIRRAGHKSIDKRAAGRAVFCVLALLLICSPALAQQGRSTAEQQRVTEKVDATWTDLLDLLSEDVWGAAEWTRGTYLGARLLAIGPDGTAIMGSRFAKASTPEAAFLSAVFLAVHGTSTDRWFIRRELETNQSKREWLKAAVGTGRAINASINEGARWENAVQYLPSPTGCRLLTRECLRSQDALVRRSGLLWGFWVADSAYWKDVQGLAQKDPDQLTRRFAAALIQRASGQ